MAVTSITSPTLHSVRDLPTGDRVTGFYLLTKLEVKPKRSGGNYLELKLQDSTATLDAKKWEEFEEFASEAKPGDIIKIEGVMDRYRDTPSLILSRVRIAVDDEVTDKRQFMPHSSVTATEAHKQLDEIVLSIQNNSIKQLLFDIFGDADFRLKFLEAPGGKLWHHATLGGLAEHTISMTKLADKICAHYPELNRDLLLSGALLHDIGKVFELSTEISIDYTSEGRLLGHIVQGTLFVEKKMDLIPDFPSETRKQILHLILSHQGDGSMGSPVKPMTLEALILHYLDELDSRVNAFNQVRAKTSDDAEFSDYVKLMERFFYFKPIEGDNGDSK